MGIQGRLLQRQGRLHSGSRGRRSQRAISGAAEGAAQVAGIRLAAGGRARGGGPLHLPRPRELYLSTFGGSSGGSDRHRPEPPGLGPLRQAKAGSGSKRSPATHRASEGTIQTFRLDVIAGTSSHICCSRVASLCAGDLTGEGCAVRAICLHVVRMPEKRALSGNVWFLTGCSPGFGRAWAESALERGEKVAATARNDTTLKPLAEAYPGVGAGAAPRFTRARRRGGPRSSTDECRVGGTSDACRV
jgi:hypothetical protein